MTPGFIEILPAQAIESPCVNICQIDPTTRLCIGCARSLHEIGGWASGTPEWRASIMAALSERRVQMERENRITANRD